VNCHTKDFKAAISPNHVKLNLSTDCASCHREIPNWTTSTFPNHDAVYPLTGAHAAIAKDCEKCHIGGNYNNTPTECVGCHKSDFNKTTNPSHTRLGISTDCASCHSTKPGWNPASFAIHSNYYVLTGAHASLATDCAKCHKGNYNTKFNDCNACHTSDFKKAVNPNHQTLNFSTDCASCHTTAPNWSPATYAAHNTFYPLTGTHASLRCNECHKGGNYINTPKDCNGCHNANYVATKNPSHVQFKISTDCATCHTTKAGWLPATFTEHNSFYPLTGGHANIKCTDCHKNGVYANTTKDCNACHNANYKSAKNPDHAGIGISTDCATCHTTNSGWRPSTFDHNKYWAFTGAHVAIKSNCVLCHKNGSTKGTPTDCNSCHNDVYKSSKNPNHEAIGLSTDCATCHTTNAGWKPTSFNHNTYWALTGAHAAIASNCNLCHTGTNYKKPPTDCNSCHNSNYKSAKNPDHAGIGISTDCATCHTTNAGWRPSTFDHNKYWAFTGAHVAIKSNCVLCHKNGSTKGTPTDCNSCHNAIYKSSKNPNHEAIGLSTDCATCHTTNAGWKPTSFNHNTYWALTGAHAAIASNCNLCHTGSNYKKPPTDCNSCHNANYKSAKNPDHAGIGISTDCASCHTTNAGWRPSTFDHNKYWAFTGAHVAIKSNCVLCHKNGSTKGTPTDCNSCHNANYKSAKNPDHAGIGISTDCASCHTTNAGWRPSTFDHNRYWAFTGAHVAIKSNCVLCHKNGSTKGTPTDCNSCHNGAYNSSVNPNHAAIGLSTDCATCHSTNAGWRPATFNHNNYWALTGAHANIASNCNLCHKGGNPKKPPTDCNSCHNGAFTGARNPSHNGFPTDCATCHTTNPGWKPSTFNHSVYYPLTGAHTSVSCVQCHAGGRYAGTPKDCNSCHNGAFTGARNPSHNGFPTDCATCHTTNSGWRPATFNHTTYWALTGAHTSVSCVQCHAGGRYAGTPKDCNSCHNGAFTGARNPSHNGFPTDCASCHTTNQGWRPATFNHSTYPLTGAHTSVSCVQCHAGGRYVGTPRDCNSCHSAAYNTAANPNHSSIKLSTNCVTCHTTNPGWKPSSFNHSTFWVLTGAHARIATSCVSCHAGGNYSRTTCFACHSADYNRASPNHATSHFPTSCTDCHSQNAWKPATWNHDTQYFPIYSGAHKGKWNNCNECHTNSGNFAIFNCLNCHKKTDTDKDHKGVKGYSYDSNSCYACHPKGKH
jgi:hypothetical protein